MLKVLLLLSRTFAVKNIALTFYLSSLILNIIQNHLFLVWTRRVLKGHRSLVCNLSMPYQPY
jgi:hypothetical protein